MKNITSTIFKYLTWALLIIVTLLYMEDFDIRQQAIVLLAGVVVIDLAFGITAMIRRGISCRKKKSAAKKSSKKKKGPTAAEAVTDAVKEAGTALRDTAENTWNAVKEKGNSVKNAVAERLGGGSAEALPSAEDNKDSK